LGNLEWSLSIDGDFFVVFWRRPSFYGGGGGGLIGQWTPSTSNEYYNNTGVEIMK